MQIRTLGSVAVQSPNPMVYQATLERGTDSTRDKLCRKPVAVSYPRVPKGEQDQNCHSTLWANLSATLQFTSRPTQGPKLSAPQMLQEAHSMYFSAAARLPRTLHATSRAKWWEAIGHSRVPTAWWWW